MIAREIERAGNYDGSNQQQFVKGFNVMLERVKKQGFVDPSEETTYDIIGRLERGRPSGSIEDAISVAINRAFPFPRQKILGQKLMGVLNSLKRMGFTEPPFK